MDDILLKMVELIWKELSSPSMNPVVIWVRELVAQIVPNAVLDKVKFDENSPEKFIRINIVNACKVLTTRLRNTVNAGDCWWYILLRKQLTDFMATCQKPLEKIPEDDSRPLRKLQEEIEKCDKSALVQNWIGKLRHLISQTNYHPREQQSGTTVNNPWSVLGSALVEVRELARETSTPLGEVEQLMDVYYTKCVDGLLLQIEEKEDLTVREWEEAFGHRNAFYGHGRGRVRIVEDPEIVRTQLMCDIVGRTSEVVWKSLVERINNHTAYKSIREARILWTMITENELHYFRQTLGYKDYEWKESTIIWDGDRCLPKIRDVSQKVKDLKDGLTAEDIKFIEEVEEMLMKVHFESINAALKIESKPHDNKYSIPPRLWISQRLQNMNADIQKTTNVKRKLVWKQWHTNLSNRLPSMSSFLIAPRWRSTAPGWAFWNRRHS